MPEDGNRQLTWRELADTLVPYVAEMGFTHLELLPISEHPFEGSWGYQPIGLFAPSSRQGSPDDFAYFVDRCHQAGIGLILDWVPGHFPTDQHGLGRFDGTALYEHEDPRLGYQMDWNTLIYNFGRREVANFLWSNALYWLERYHVDGLRVDAVASMLYLDYSRQPGQWIPNKFGGRENLEAINFLRRLNELAYGEQPGTMTVAEESTAWPAVSRPLYVGGLGFGFKWNMGWMHDSLHYMQTDPVYRKYHQNDLTFGLLYAWSENFVLPLSHDEVVHLQGLAADQDAGRRVAEGGEPSGLLRLHVDPSGQEAALHGRRVRPVAGVEPRYQPRLASPERWAVPQGHPVGPARPQPPLSRAAGPARARLRAGRLRVDRLHRLRTTASSPSCAGTRIAAATPSP